MLIVVGAGGGVGCSCVAAALALYGARRAPTLLVDLAGDAGLLFGRSEPETGLRQWLAAPAPPPDAIRRIEVGLGDRLSLLAAGPGPESRVSAPLAAPQERWEVLAGLLAADERLVVIDGGLLDRLPAPIGGRAGPLLVVTRLCHLGLHRARRSLTAHPGVVDGLVVIAEPGRVLTPDDASEALSAPVRALIRWDPLVAAAVDTGNFAPRPPRALRQLGRLLP